MKKTLFCLYLIIGFNLFGFSDEKFTLSSFSEFINSYYLNKEENKIFDAIKFSSKNSELNEKGVKPICFSFYSSIFRENKSLLEEVNNKIASSNDKKLKYYFIDILWLTNTIDSKTLLSHITSDNSKMVTFLKKRIDNPYDFISDKSQNGLLLDMQWAAFFGTGNKIYLKKIINTINLKNDGHGSDIMVGSAAEWSLQSNVNQHQRVYELVKDEIENNENNDQIKEVLKQIIKNAEIEKMKQQF